MPGRGAMTLFKVRGIRIGVDYSWFFVLFLIIWMLSDFYRDLLDAASGDAGPYLLALVSALAFFASILLHELGHAFVAMRRGIGISDITLWMFGGVAGGRARRGGHPGTDRVRARPRDLLVAARNSGCGRLCGGRRRPSRPPASRNSSGGGRRRGGRR